MNNRSADCMVHFTPHDSTQCIGVLEGAALAFFIQETQRYACSGDTESISPTAENGTASNDPTGRSSNS